MIRILTKYGIAIAVLLPCAYLVGYLYSRRCTTDNIANFQRTQRDLIFELEEKQTMINENRHTLQIRNDSLKHIITVDLPVIQSKKDSLSEVITAMKQRVAALKGDAPDDALKLATLSHEIALLSATYLASITNESRLNNLLAKTTELQNLQNQTESLRSAQNRNLCQNDFNIKFPKGSEVWWFIDGDGHTSSSYKKATALRVAFSRSQGIYTSTPNEVVTFELREKPISRNDPKSGTLERQPVALQWDTVHIDTYNYMVEVPLLPRTIKGQVYVLEAKNTSGEPIGSREFNFKVK